MPLETSVQRTLTIDSAPAYPSGCTYAGGTTETQASGLPASGIAAVTLNVTITNTSKTNGGYLSVYTGNLPSYPGSSQPTTSNINFSYNASGDFSVANQVVVQVSAAGTVNFMAVMANNDSSAVQVEVDAEGWYSNTTTTGYLYVPLAPARIADSVCTLPAGFAAITTANHFDTLSLDSASSYSQSNNAPVNFNSTSCANHNTGSSGLPSSGIAAVIVNVSANFSAASAGDYLQVCAYDPSGYCGVMSSLSYSAPIVENQVTAVPDASGKIMIDAAMSGNNDSINVIVDVEGYYIASSGDSYVPLAPARIAESVSGCRFPSSSFQTLTSTNTSDTLSLNSASAYNGCAAAGSSGLPSSGIAAVVFNVTMIVNSGSGGGQVTLSNGTVPPTWSLDYASGINADLVTVAPSSSDMIKLSATFNNSGDSHGFDVLIDVEGYFVSSNNPPSPGDTFTPVSPVRIANAACPTPEPTGFAQLTTSTTHTSLTFSSSTTTYTGCPGTMGSIDLSSAVAVVLNVTVVNTTGSNQRGGYITVCPAPGSGGCTVSTSNVNFTAGETIPNEVTVATSSSDAITFNATFNNGSDTSKAELEVDVEGYYTASTGDTFVPIAPARIADSRCPIPSGFSTLTGTKTDTLSLGAASSVIGPSTCQSSTASGLPPKAAIAAVVLNVTVVVKSPSTGGTLSVLPHCSSSCTAPSLWTMDFTSGQTIANEVTVAPDSNGEVDFVASTDPNYGFDVIVDVTGWYTSTAGDGDYYMPAAPVRIADSSCPYPAGFDALTTPDPESLAVAGAQTHSPTSPCPPTGPSGVPASGVAAADANVTVVNASSANGGYVTVYAGSTIPPTSTINLSAGLTIANHVTVGLWSDGTMSVKGYLNSDDTSSIRVIVDVFGWFIGGNQQVQTIAGNGTWGNSNVSGTGTLATGRELEAPHGVAVDAKGNIYVADTSNNEVDVINHAGLLSVYAGNGTAGYTGNGGAATSAELDHPWGLAIDASGDLYIADSLNCAIREVLASNLTIITYAGPQPPVACGFQDGTSAKFNDPKGISIDASGDLLVADANNHRVREITPGSPPNTSTVAGNGTSGCGGNGGSATSANLTDPARVGVGLNGWLYVADEACNQVRSFLVGGNIDAFAGTGTAGFSGDGGLATSAKLHSPYDVAVDSSGNVAIADLNNGRIRVVQNGTMSSVGGIRWVNTGALFGASLDVSMYPYGAAFTSGGDLLEADANNMVREIPAAAVDSPYANASSPPATSVNGAVATPVENGIQGFGNSNIGDSTVGSNIVGADGSYSVELPNGKVAWFYSDTEYGFVNSDHTTSWTLQDHVHNSFVSQDSPTSPVRHTVFDTNGNDQEYFKPPGSDSCNTKHGNCYFWISGVILENATTLEVLLNETYGNGLITAGVSVATVNLNSLGSAPVVTDISASALNIATNQSCTPTTSFTDNLLTTYVSGTQYTYIYGSVQCDVWDSYGFVARVSGVDLTGTWSYFNGANQSCSSDNTSSFSATGPASAMCTGNSLFTLAGCEMSVNASGGGYRMVSTGTCWLGADVSTATTPVGGWTTLAELVLPEEGMLPYNDAGSGCELTAYNAKEHPELESSGDIVISYNVNYWPGVTGCTYPASPVIPNADNYRPRFVVVRIYGG